MTRRYLVCATDADGPCLLPPALERALERNGCSERAGTGNPRLFAEADLAVRAIRGSSGWLVGELFDRSNRLVEGPVHLDVLADGLREQLRRYWGSYVLVSASGPLLRAARDPSGGLACYHANIGAMHYFTSLPHLLVDCELLSGTLCWPEVVRALAVHSERTSQTAIEEIGELLPGTAVTLARAGTKRDDPWNPWDYAAPVDQSPSETLEQALSGTLEAWGRICRRPLIEISGGLDSGIVAAGLSRAAPDAALITFAPAPGDPDETPYARAIADHLERPLHIARPQVGAVDLSRSLSSDLPRPNARAFTQAADRESLDFAKAIGADAFVSGGGGDDVFCYLRTILPAIDRMRTEGVRAMLATAYDIAVMNHATVAEALVRIVARLARGGSASDRLDARFLNPDRLPPDRASRKEVHRLPGKEQHVRGVMTIHNYLEGHARAAFAPILSPLLSQPIVEACLAIPSWRWCEGGRNRSVVRSAYRNRLPKIAVERRSKGRFDGFCAALLDANRPLVHSMLLEGHLARERLLDRMAISAALREPLPSAETVSRLLALVDVEAWVGSWSSRASEP